MITHNRLFSSHLSSRHRSIVSQILYTFCSFLVRFLITSLVFGQSFVICRFFKIFHHFDECRTFFSHILITFLIDFETFFAIF